MVRALFDSDVLIDFLSGEAQASSEFHRYDDVAISVISRIEVLVGARPETMDATRIFLRQFGLVDLTDTIAEEAVVLRKSRRIRLPDAIIWASARIEGRLLVTRNAKDFPTDDPGIRIPYRV